MASVHSTADDLKVDTHGANVIEPVWQLLRAAYENFGPMPTLLERDFNIPPMAELFAEVSQIKALQTDVSTHRDSIPKVS